MRHDDRVEGPDCQAVPHFTPLLLSDKIRQAGASQELERNMGYEGDFGFPDGPGVDGLGVRGKVAIVTGASRGIGKAIALGLAQGGASVVVAARSREPRPDLPGTIQETVSQIENSGGTALAVACDVRDDDSIRELVEQTLDEYGAVDVLINNAGIGGYTPFLQSGT